MRLVATPPNTPRRKSGKDPLFVAEAFPHAGHSGAGHGWDEGPRRSVIIAASNFAPNPSSPRGPREVTCRVEQSNSMVCVCQHASCREYEAEGHRTERSQDVSSILIRPDDFPPDETCGQGPV